MGPRISRGLRPLKVRDDELKRLVSQWGREFLAACDDKQKRRERRARLSQWGREFLAACDLAATKYHIQGSKGSQWGREFLAACD